MISRTTRVPGAQALRGLAALGVCWFHLTAVTDAKDAWFALAGGFGWLGVQVFFVISGFVIPFALYRAGYDASQFFRFAVKRIVRVDPPYFVTILIILLLNFAAANTPGFMGPPYRVEFAQVALHAGYLVGFTKYGWLNNAFWTLALEFQYYVLIGLLFGYVATKSRVRRLAFAAVFVALSFISAEEKVVTCYFALFLMGITLFQLYCGLIQRGEGALTLCVLVLAAIARLGAASAGAGVFAVLFIPLFHYHIRILAWLGDVSYSLYLIHVPVGIKIMNLGSRFLHGHAEQAALLLLALAGCLGSAVLLNRFVEKPAQAMASSIRYSSLRRTMAYD